MSRYVVFVVEDEEAWEARSPEQRQEVYDTDGRFIQLLESRGGKVIGGAELDHTSTWHWLERRGGVTSTRQGPYAESVEQLGGFYIVECEGDEAVLEAVAEMLEPHVRVEVAPVLGH